MTEDDVMVDTAILEVAKYLKISPREIDNCWSLSDIFRVYASFIEEKQSEFYSYKDMEKGMKK